MSSLSRRVCMCENLDNQDSTDTLENIAAIGIAALVVKMENEKKATHKYLYISGS